MWMMPKISTDMPSSTPSRPSRRRSRNAANRMCRLSAHRRGAQVEPAHRMRLHPAYRLAVGAGIVDGIGEERGRVRDQRFLHVDVVLLLHGRIGAEASGVERTVDCLVGV